MMRDDLPAWLEVLLPTVEPPSEMVLDGDMICLRAPDGALRRLSADFEEAYDSLSDDEQDNLLFSPPVRERFTEKDSFLSDETHLLLLPYANGNSRMVSGGSDEHRRESLVRDYADAGKAYTEWAANKDDFYASYAMVDTHPAFWVRRHDLGLSTTPWRRRMLWEWRTGGYLDTIPVRVFREDGEVAVFIECGAHIPDEDRPTPDDAHVNLVGAYTDNYGGGRLSIWESTYELAIVQLARQVDEFFHPDGTEREDVDREPSELEKLLDERIGEESRRSHQEWHDSLPVVDFADYPNWLREHGCAVPFGAIWNGSRG